MPGYPAQLVANSQYSVRAAKAVVGAVIEAAREPNDALNQQVRGAFVCEDLSEGYRAFNARRKPVFCWR